MSSPMNQSNLQNEQWIRRMAELEDEHPSISVGGMVADLGMFKSPAAMTSGIFGRFVEFVTVIAKYGMHIIIRVFHLGVRILLWKTGSH